MYVIYFQIYHISFLGVEMINKFKEWHINLIERVQELTGFSNYQIILISFIEGLVIGLVIGYFL